MDFRDEDRCPSCGLPYEVQTTKTNFYSERGSIVFCEKYGKIYLHEY